VDVAVAQWKSSCSCARAPACRPRGPSCWIGAVMYVLVCTLTAAGTLLYSKERQVLYTDDRAALYGTVVDDAAQPDAGSCRPS